MLRHSPRVDALVVLTERSADWLAARFGDRAPRIEVIPNALPAIARPQSSVTQHVVMAAGRFVGAKGFVNLVRAFGRVADDYPDWRLRLFGDGPQHERILKMARNLGIAAQVRSSHRRTPSGECSLPSAPLCRRARTLVLMEGAQAASWHSTARPGRARSSVMEGRLSRRTGHIAGFAGTAPAHGG